MNTPDIGAELSEIRKQLAKGQTAQAKFRLRALTARHPDDVEVKALLVRAISSVPFPSPEVMDEIDAAMNSAPKEDEDLFRFVRFLIDEGCGHVVERAISDRWKELLHAEPPDDEAVLRATTLFAEGMLAWRRGSTALDVVEEARAVLPLAELETLYWRIREGFDPNDEPPMAELHAVRRKMKHWYLDECGTDMFSDEQELRLFMHAFQAAWNERMREKPLPYGMLERAEKQEYLETLYENLLERIEALEDAGDQPSHDTLPAERRNVAPKSRKEKFTTRAAKKRKNKKPKKR